MYEIRFCIEPKWCEMLMLLIAHTFANAYYLAHIYVLYMRAGPNLYLRCIFMNKNLFTDMYIQKSTHSQKCCWRTRKSKRARNVHVCILLCSQICTQKLYWIMSISVWFNLLGACVYYRIINVWTCVPKQVDFSLSFSLFTTFGFLWKKYLFDEIDVRLNMQILSIHSPSCRFTIRFIFNESHFL